MSEHFETKRCIKALYKYTSFSFLSFTIVDYSQHDYKLCLSLILSSEQWESLDSTARWCSDKEIGLTTFSPRINSQPSHFLIISEIVNRILWVHYFGI